jgi:hypothetical protein
MRIPHLATATSGRDTITLPLYRAHRSLDINGTWGPGGISTAIVTGGGTHWLAQPVLFAEHGEAHAGYLRRIVSLEVRLSWENQPTAFGDLAAAAGPQRDEPSRRRWRHQCGAGAP